MYVDRFSPGLLYHNSSNCERLPGGVSVFLYGYSCILHFLVGGAWLNNGYLLPGCHEPWHKCAGLVASHLAQSPLAHPEYSTTRRETLQTPPDSCNSSPFSRDEASLPSFCENLYIHHTISRKFVFMLPLMKKFVALFPQVHWFAVVRRPLTHPHARM